MEALEKFMEEAAHVVPSPRQRQWFDTEFYAFVHFGVNTFTDREWGLGNEPEAIFNPEKLDCDQWVRAMQSAGMKGMVLTAKHHDGFCLWPSKYTEHSVKNSPFQGDVVKQASDACRRAGLKFGVYLSPWDRNNPLYGTPEYNDYFCRQLTELMTNYGELFCVWFDNACGEGPNGKKQVYDFPRYIELIRKYQPNAVIFNDFGPDVRWCGNEAGSPRQAEWSVVPTEMCPNSPVQTGPGPLAAHGDITGTFNTDQLTGSLSQILFSRGLVYAPCEINMSIRPGWFWHENEDPHPLERLFCTYLKSVGANACFHLNLPPNRDGLIDERVVKRLAELGEMIRRELGMPMEAKSRRADDGASWQGEWEMELPADAPAPRYVVLEEDLDFGQRVESFRIFSDTNGGEHFPLYQGTTVGHRAVCCLCDPFAGQNPLTDDSTGKARLLRLKITSCRCEPHLARIAVY